MADYNWISDDPQAAQAKETTLAGGEVVKVTPSGAVYYSGSGQRISGGVSISNDALTQTGTAAPTPTPDPAAPLNPADPYHTVSAPGTPNTAPPTQTSTQVAAQQNTTSQPTPYQGAIPQGPGITYPVGGAPGGGNTAPVTTYGQPTPQTTATGGGTGTPTYSGPSIVDYLASTGQPSDFNSRSVLAAQHGIQNYTGTAAQNTQLLNEMRSAQGKVGGSGITTPSGTVGDSGTMGQESAQKATTGTDKWAGLDPIEKQFAMYTEAYNKLGLATIKQQTDDFTKQLTDITNEMNDKMAANQNNPWLAQGIVDKENQKLKDKYDIKINTFSNLAKLSQALYEKGLAQVDHMVSDANADIKATNDLAQKQLDAATALAKDNVVVDTGGRQLLKNKVTGQTIADLGPSTKTTLGDKEALAAFTAALKDNNKGGPGGTSQTNEEKQIDAFRKDAAGYVEKLGASTPTISWATAFNAMKAQYPQASNELIDQTLGKDKYYTVK